MDQDKDKKGNTIIPEVWVTHWDTDWGPHVENVSVKPWEDWYDAPITKFASNVRYVRAEAQTEQCFEVREGYTVAAYKDGTVIPATLQGAVSIRSVEDVRREALEEVQMRLRNASCSKEHVTVMTLVDNLLSTMIDAPAPSREKPQSEPEQTPVEILRFTLTGGGFAPEKLVRDPNGNLMLYDQAHLVSQPEPDELRQAKAEAWEEGYLNYLSGKNPYAAPDEGGE